MSQTAITDYYCILTEAGSALEAEAHARGVPVRISHIAVGDGGGEVPAPDKKAVALVHEVYRRQIDSSRIDEDDPNICWISAVIPADVGGFWIREFAIYAQPLDEGGEPVFYAWGNHAPYYKIDRILGQATTHELEIPIIMSGTANVQIVVKESGYASQSALNGLATMIGQMKIVDREYGERISALEQFDKLHDIIATLEKLGHVKPDGMTIGIKTDGTIYVTQGSIYRLGETYFFDHPDPEPGFVPCYGGLITDVDQKYPEAWAYFQTEHGQKRCCTEEEWQAASHAIWHTNADGTQVGWNGIGGAVKFVLDVTNKTLRMPDKRGMVPECPGGPDSPGVGQAGGDGIRGFGGWMGYFCESVVWNEIAQGIIEIETLSHPDFAPQIANPGNGDYNYTRFNLAPKRQIPVFSVNRMRSWGSLVCAYLGQPG